MQAASRCPEQCYSLDKWHGSLVLLRSFLKGWNIQRMGEQKKNKFELKEELQRIDKQAEIRELSSQEWEHRYVVERDLEQVYLMEESYWKQRAGKHWLLAGDSNTKFFHHFANGRRRKGSIFSMESEQGQLTKQDDIMAHIVQFYKQLFGGWMLDRLD